MKIVADPIDFIRHFTFQRWVSRLEGDNKLQEALKQARVRDNDFVNAWTDVDGVPKEGGQKRGEVQVFGAATPATATQRFLTKMPDGALPSGITNIDLRIVLSLYNREDEDLTAVIHVSSDKAVAVTELARWFDMNNVSVWSYAKLREREDCDELRICIDHSALVISPFTMTSSFYLQNIAATLQCLVERTACLLNCDDPDQVIIYPSPVNQLNHLHRHHGVKSSTNDTTAPE